MISFQEQKRIFARKLLHFLIAFSPLLSALSYPLTVILLAVGTTLYAFLESYRISGGTIPLISNIVKYVSHSRDKDRYVLGPVTLGGGALCCLLFYPEKAFTVAVLALAFGDGLAGLAGRTFGRIRLKILGGKSVEGFLACFAATFIVAFLVLDDIKVSLLAALTASVVEALPTEDFDNVLIPLSVGLVVFAATG